MILKHQLTGEVTCFPNSCRALLLTCSNQKCLGNDLQQLRSLLHISLLKSFVEENNFYNLNFHRVVGVSIYWRNWIILIVVVNVVTPFSWHNNVYLLMKINSEKFNFIFIYLKLEIKLKLVYTQIYWIQLNVKWLNILNTRRRKVGWN